MQAHSLRPHTMVGHLKLYRSVLHHPDNSLPLWFLEAVGVYTSLLNECVHSYTHRFANMQRLLEDPQRSKVIEEALRDQARESLHWQRARVDPLHRQIDSHPRQNQ